MVRSHESRVALRWFVQRESVHVQQPIDTLPLNPLRLRHESMASLTTPKPVSLISQILRVRSQSLVFRSANTTVSSKLHI